LEDVPAWARPCSARPSPQLGRRFHRIQFTPDCCRPTSPAAASTTVRRTSSFSVRAGLRQRGIGRRDHRATPRTQSALLESMSERQVSATARRIRCPGRSCDRHAKPVEFEGTYPARSQLDRFLLRIPLAIQAGRRTASAYEPSRGRAGRFAGAALDCDQVARCSGVRQVAFEIRSTSTCWTSSKRRDDATSCTSA